MVVALLYNCSSAKIQDSSEIKAIVENGHFNIYSQIAQPSATIGLSQLQNSGVLGAGNSASNINLIGNSNFLKIMGDSISSYLPFYGDRYSNAGYGSDDIGIQFKGTMKDYNIIWNDKKQHYKITCKAKSNNEMFDVIVLLYPNLKSYITLSSALRSTITYVGTVTAINSNRLKNV